MNKSLSFDLGFILRIISIALCLCVDICKYYVVIIKCYLRITYYDDDDNDNDNDDDWLW